MGYLSVHAITLFLCRSRGVLTRQVGQPAVCPSCSADVDWQYTEATPEKNDVLTAHFVPVCRHRCTQDQMGSQLRSTRGFPPTGSQLKQVRCRRDGRLETPNRRTAVIDSELQLLVAVRQATSGEGGPLPSMALIDELLDERSA
jgi:hypothetical protein